MARGTGRSQRSARGSDRQCTCYGSGVEEGSEGSPTDCPVRPSSKDRLDRRRPFRRELPCGYATEDKTLSRVPTVVDWTLMLTLGRDTIVWNCHVNIRKAALGWNYVNNGKVPLRRNCDVNIGRATLKALRPGRCGEGKHAAPAGNRIATPRSYSPQYRHYRPANMRSGYI
jgi:hypothetical protein